MTINSQTKFLPLYIISLIILVIFFVIYIHKETFGKRLKKELLLQKTIPIYHYKIIQVFPHSKNNFTEGLILDKNTLYESTGLYNHSKLLKTILQTGKIIKKTNLPHQYFGEGIAILDAEIFQLTYRSHTGFVYNKNTLKLKKTFHYSTEGWGLTTDGKRLIMSDGSSYLYFIDPHTFKIKKHLFITDNNKPIPFLNDLTYANGLIYANIWKTDVIVIIVAKTGKVIGWIDFTDINPKENKSEHVLNGITYRPETNTFLVTGKCWSRIYEIKILV